jgi:hypothetical protein
LDLDASAILTHGVPVASIHSLIGLGEEPRVILQI